VLAASAAASAGAGPSPACPAGLASLVGPALELLLVTTPSWSATAANLRRYARAAPGEGWTAVEPAAEAVVGRRGLAWGHGFETFRQPGEPRKTEGDGRTPAGFFRLGRRFGTEGPADGDFLRLGADTLCIDDPGSRHYNRIIDGAKVRRDWRSAERMGAIRYYRRGFEVLYPSSRPARAGSCIFIHEWERAGQGTAGCIAAAPPTLARLHGQALLPEHRPVLVVLTEDRLQAFRACWPELPAESQKLPSP
jgi:L,D-peptidoglycan transpeptidase YkuD (ErfK/YbiS/YcfS/YnhG family)